MTKRYVCCGLLTCAAFLATTLAARRAHAKDCLEDADCPRGFACTVPASSAVAGSAGSCLPLICHSDADCAPAMRCNVGEVIGCHSTADGGTSCFFASECVPQWEAPCSVDAECGPGFTCSGNPVTSEVCRVNEADVVASPDQTVMTVPCGSVDAGFSTYAGDGGCDAGITCVSITSKSCVTPERHACTTDSDCVSTWTCACPSCLPPQSSGSCGKQCVAPNSDFAIVPCGPTEPAPTPGATIDGGRDAGEIAVTMPGTAGGGGSGGCQLAARDTGSRWALGVEAMFLWGLRRASRKGRWVRSRRQRDARHGRQASRE